MLKNIGRRIFRKTVKFLNHGWGLARFRSVATVYSFFYSLVKEKEDKPVLINGFEMILDKNDSLGLSVWGVYEEAQTSLVKKEIEKDSWILDIGANIGYYTLLFSRLAGLGGRVFAFEPDPENFFVLKSNLENNNISNVIAESVAVGESSGELKLFRNLENAGDSRVFSVASHIPAETIAVIKLDDYFKEEDVAKIKFVKIDVQGFEIAVLRGMKKILGATGNLKVMVEFWPKAIAAAGFNPREFFTIFRESGFSIFRIDEKNKSLIPVINDIEILSELAPEKDRDTNFLCVKSGL